MKLRKLISELQVEIYRGGKETEITGLCSNSKTVAPGNLFIAKKGSSDDGARHIQEAISNGAVAILTDHPNPFLNKEIVQLIHQDTQKLEVILASRFYEFPSEHLFMIGVTGTSGKTTIATLTQYLLTNLKYPCGLIGTIEYCLGHLRLTADRTTPDLLTTYKLQREMIRQGCLACAMEVSSHGLVQARVENIEFDVAIFSNLSQDHLDYHGNMEAYACAKQMLFNGLAKESVAIVNKDSPWCDYMVKNSQASILTYGFSPNAALHAKEIHLTAQGTEFTVNFQENTERFYTKLVGPHNVLNCLASIATCLVKGYTLEQIKYPLESFFPVAGRLEKVDNALGLSIYVDYAHKPGALEQVLKCLKELNNEGRIFVVFGCGGDRDREKRPLMGKIADAISDFTIITSDNPRGEDPSSICMSIAKGFTSSNYCVELDRKKAIQQAIELATDRDLILVAGKGHETYQIFAHKSIPFDDKKVIQEIAINLAREKGACC